MTVGPGTYVARAIETALGVAGTGTEQIGVRFIFVDDPAQSITWYGTFTEAAFPYTMAALRRAGFEGSDLFDDSWLQRSPEVSLVLEEEVYKDKKTLKVKYINSLGGLAMTNRMEDVAAKNFAERMRNRILLFDQQNGTPARRTTEPAAAPKARGDVPF